jgi:hypothetical protein
VQHADLEGARGEPAYPRFGAYDDIFAASFIYFFLL